VPPSSASALGTSGFTARLPAAGSRWIMSPSVDVATVLLPAVTGYACLYANAALGVSSFLIWWFWNVAFNGGHMFATLSRTYLDRDEWARRTPLLVGSLAWVLVGPVALAASLALHSPGPFLVFWAFSVLWAYYHVTRQHYGFLSLYQKLNGEPAGRANRIDYWVFHLLMFGPVLSWFVQYSELRDAFGWSIALSANERLLVDATRIGVAALLVAYLGRELWAAYRRTVNLPKVLLFLAYVPLHLLLLLYPTVVGRYDILLFNAVITLPHNVQYLAIVWFHNKNRYHTPEARQHYGLAASVSATLPWFLGVATVYGVVFYYVRWVLEGSPVPLLPARFAWSHLSLGMSYTVADLVSAIWIGFIFHHQYLDQRIWKISSDRRLNHDLHLNARAA
jgi:hypothetical protein